MMTDGWRQNRRKDWGHWADHGDGLGLTMDTIICRRHMGLARLLCGKYFVSTFPPLPPMTRSARTLKGARKIADLMLLPGNPLHEADGLEGQA